MMFDSRRGNVALIVIPLVMVIVFVVAVMYMVMTPGVQEIHDKVEPDIDADHLPTFNKIKDSWDRWPIITIFLAIFAGVVAIARAYYRDPYMPY